MKIQKEIELLHPILQTCVEKIQLKIIRKYNFPMRIFETGRTNERHQYLLNKGKTKEVFSKHLYKVDNNPPQYSFAVDYVLYQGSWTWNLRDMTTASWYQLFGNLVLDLCPEMSWGGTKRKAINFTHFELKQKVIIDNLDKYPCVLY